MAEFDVSRIKLFSNRTEDRMHLKVVTVLRKNDNIGEGLQVGSHCCFDQSLFVLVQWILQKHWLLSPEFQ